MNNHIARTWVLANLLHSLILALYFGIGFSASAGEAIILLLPMLISSFVLSLPSLGLCYLPGSFITNIPGEAALKLVVWIIAALFIVTLNWILILFIFFNVFFEIEIMAPAMLSVFVAVICRIPYFLKAVKQIGH